MKRKVDFGSVLSVEVLDERIALLKDDPVPKAQQEMELLLDEKIRRHNLPKTKIKKTKYPCANCKKPALCCGDCDLIKQWQNTPAKQRDYTDK